MELCVPCRQQLVMRRTRESTAVTTMKVLKQETVTLHQKMNYRIAVAVERRLHQWWDHHRRRSHHVQWSPPEEAFVVPILLRIPETAGEGCTAKMNVNRFKGRSKRHSLNKLQPQLFIMDFTFKSYD